MLEEILRGVQRNDNIERFRLNYFNYIFIQKATISKSKTHLWPSKLVPTPRPAQRWLSILTTFAHYLLRSTISDINENSPFILQSNAGYRSAIRLAKTIACALQFSPRWRDQHQVRSH